MMKRQTIFMPNLPRLDFEAPDSDDRLSSQRGREAWTKKMQLHIETSVLSSNESSYHSRAESILAARKPKPSTKINHEALLSERQDKVDKIFRQFNGIFYCHEKQIVYSRHSFLCLGDSNVIRNMAVWLVNWSFFNHFILASIMVNSFVLAATDYEYRLDPEYESEWAVRQEKVDILFTVIFVLEAFLKMLAMGIYFHKHSYLKDSWNVLDFVIVLISIVSILPIGLKQNSLKGLRVFRILRPLKSIQQMPALKLHV